MSFQRPKSLTEVAANIRNGGDAGHELKDLLHEFRENGTYAMLCDEPPRIEESVPNAMMLNAFLQALAVHLSVRLNCEPPAWTRDPIRLPRPWFASPGVAMRNYLLMTSPAPFRTRNLFIDDDSLTVA